MSLQEVHACVDEMYTDDFSVEAEKKIADVQVRPARAYISFRKTIVGYCYLKYVTIGDDARRDFNSPPHPST